MSGSTACPYEILGVSDLADEAEIKSAFEAKLASCKQAYELLIDAKKRRAFDRQKTDKKEKVKIAYLFFQI